MKYQTISADCHIDFPWLPSDLFVDNAPSELKARMPYVEQRPNGSFWVTKSGSQFGLQNGMGSAGRVYEPGVIHRSDRMAEQGLYDDGNNGIPRLTTPALRIKDQDLDGIQAEVLYGVLGAAMRMRDNEASEVLLSIYNAWLADFCDVVPERFAGIASIPGHSVEAAVAEVQRVANRGGVRGLEIAYSQDMDPLFHPSWDPLWRLIAESRLPVHFHTIGQSFPYKQTEFEPLQKRQAFAVHITGFQLAMARIIMEIIYGGVLEAHPHLKVVVGESGIGWIPYLLEHMDLEWRDQFADLTLKEKPSFYWHRQCYATYQSDPIGLRLLDILGVDNIMWGSDFPHPDGVWPDSQDFIAREFEGVDEEAKYKITCGNAAKLYGFEAYMN